VTDEHGLAAALRDLGVRPGRDLLVHCSLRRLDPVPAGPATVLAAVRAAAGPDATIVVPAQTPQNSPTSMAFLTATRGMTSEQAAAFRDGLPGFDPATTPAGMAGFAEHVRTRPGAGRSGHPLTSFAAYGPRAARCTAVHRLDSLLGDGSPLGWLYEHDAAVLLLGVGYEACTALHLAEYRVPGLRPRRGYRCLVARDGARTELEFTGLAVDDSWLEEFGRRLDREPFTRVGQVGDAFIRSIPMRPMVDAAVSWLSDRRREA
jgi:aminoglycoside 3-N-acetyltransferase